MNKTYTKGDIETSARKLAVLYFNRRIAFSPLSWEKRIEGFSELNKLMFKFLTERITERGFAVVPGDPNIDRTSYRRLHDRTIGMIAAAIDRKVAEGATKH
jgi:hypothetical protein